MKVQNTKSKIFKVVLYIVLTAMALIMLVPFVWMLSASFKLDKDVFIFPIQWIPTNPRWQNYLDIWTRIPLGKFVLNTVKLTLIVTFLQLLTSSFAAYAFAKLSFKGKDLLFMAYIATIAVPWQVYMVPQFMMIDVYKRQGILREDFTYHLKAAGIKLHLLVRVHLPCLLTVHLPMGSQETAGGKVQL